MKTQIIQLESHDDTISIKDKMGWSQTPRILLVWPNHGRILDRHIDLLLLKRHSSLLGAQLAFVTKDSDVRYNAALLDIPVYRNTLRAEKSHWRPSHRRRKKKKGVGNDISLLYYSHRIKRRTKGELIEIHDLAKPAPKAWLRHSITRLILFTFGVCGVLAIGAVLVPSAEISLTPQTEWQEITFPIVGSSHILSVDFSGIVPIHKVSVTVEGRGQVPTSGKISLPVTKAHGTVFFKNLTDRDISIPSGTIISSSGKDDARFIITETIRVGVGMESEPVPVEAVVPGSKSNIAAHQLNAIEGSLGLDLSVTNPQAISNGKDQVLPAPSDHDYQILSSEIISKLHDAALDEIIKKLDQGDHLLTAKPDDYLIIEENFTPALVEPADFLQIKIKADFQANIVLGEDVEKLADHYLDANLETGYSSMLSSQVEIDHLSGPSLFSDGTYRWKVNATRQIAANIDRDDLIPFLLWQKPKEAADNLLSEFPSIRTISIELNPSWWPRLPILPFRLEFDRVN